MAQCLSIQPDPTLLDLGASRQACRIVRELVIGRRGAAMRITYVSALEVRRATSFSGFARRGSRIAAVPPYEAVMQP
jgi:hypothetical protein